jgi:hypothetical protein
MTKACVLLCALAVACGNPDDALVSDDAIEGQLSELVRATVDDAATTAPFEAVSQDCYANTSASTAAREVHAIGRYLALGETMMLVRVSIPEAPELAQCIEAAVMHEAPPGWSQAPDALLNGSFAIDLGGPAKAVEVSDLARQYDEHVQGMAALMREVVERGLLPADHRLVTEALAAVQALE